jgi:hypothetical protein
MAQAQQQVAGVMAKCSREMDGEESLFDFAERVVHGVKLVP